VGEKTAASFPRSKRRKREKISSGSRLELSWSHLSRTSPAEDQLYQLMARRAFIIPG
jgi:hypothetical protein